MTLYTTFHQEGQEMCKSLYLQSIDNLTSFPGSPIFSTHTRKEGAPGIQCHVCDVGPYTRVGRVADRENCAWGARFSSALVRHW